VDKSPDSEIYSNGLRIDTRFESPSHPRAYLAFPAFPVDRPNSVTGDTAGVRRTAPSGIVFHTTERPQLPFEASANSGLKQVGESLGTVTISRLCAPPARPRSVVGSGSV
jgi:hypothetical protein